MWHPFVSRLMEGRALIAAISVQNERSVSDLGWFNGFAFLFVFKAAFAPILLSGVSGFVRDDSEGSASPSKTPHALRFGTLSNMTFKTASPGIARNIPGIPQSTPPTSTPIIVTSAFILT